MPPSNMAGSASNTAFINNPGPALIARRTTVLAPPSLSTVNHLDGVDSSTASSSSSASTPASASTSRPSTNATALSARRHRSDLQQAVSQPTAAVPISTHENISTAKTWSSGLHLRGNSSSGASASTLHQRSYSGVCSGGEAEEFVVHPTFRSDAESRGDVLVRVDGVEFWVHKDVLLFSSPFFKSVLAGGWSESRLSRLVGAAEESSITQTGDCLCRHARAPVGEGVARIQEAESSSETQPTTGEIALTNPQRPAFSTNISGDSATDDHRQDRMESELSSGILGSDEARRRSLFRASYHTALWSQDDDARASPMLFQDSVEERTSATSDQSEAEDADEGGGKSDHRDALWREAVKQTADETNSADESELQCLRDNTTGTRSRSNSKRIAAELALKKLEHGRDEPQAPDSTTREEDADVETAPQQRMESLATPPVSRRASDTAQSAPTVLDCNTDAAAAEIDTAPDRSYAAGHGKGTALPPPYEGIISVVDLTEESASTFHDFLFHIYPHLDLSVTWYNCGPLLRFSDKFQVPFLRRSCVTFLRAALAGRPIEAMRLAELHNLDDLYREASRHVLDNFAAWLPDELEVLSSETLLKLERKRTWFLERLLKLGLANPARDYECHAACPDPQACARALHDKWQMAYKAAFRFSPPQPSVIFRYLRELDSIGVGISGATVSGVVAAPLQLSNCQTTARVWVQGLFDRMFELGTLHTGRLFLAVKLDAVGVGRKGAHLQ
ncbi:BTB domain-containing protein [Pseudozyma hubeiensis]|nr:BTB domain-containing protein [Pseudozyma hubeiensis]